MIKRKRAKGGGRKATGPFTGKMGNLSTRITPRTREALDAATLARFQKRDGRSWSLSQEIETRLTESLERDGFMEAAE